MPDFQTSQIIFTLLAEIRLGIEPPRHCSCPLKHLFAACSHMNLPHVLFRFVEWIPEVPADVSWLFGVAGDVYRQAWKGTPAISDRYEMIPLHKAPPTSIQVSSLALV